VNVHSLIGEGCNEQIFEVPHITVHVMANNEEINIETTYVLKNSFD
jgi:hypothetical protein